MKFYLYFFLALYSCNHLNSQELSKNNLLFEQAWINKNIADQIFIKKELYDSNQAKIYYEKAQQLFDKIDTTALAKSDVYFPNVSKRKALIKLIGTDLKYRLLLINNGIDYWGLDYHQRVLYPNVYAKKFIDMYKDFDELHQKFEKWMEVLGKEEENNLIRKLDELENRYNQRTIQVDIQKFNKEEEFYSNQLMVFGSDYKNKMKQGKALADEAERTINTINSLEQKLMKIVQGAAMSYLNNNLLEGDLAELKLEELGNIKKMNPETVKMINGIVGTTTGMQEILNTTNDLHAFYNDVKEVVNVGEKLMNMLEDSPNNVSDFLTIGAEVSSLLKLNENSLQSGIDLEQKLNWVKKVDELSQLAENQLNVAECINSNGVSATCLKRKITRLRNTASDLDNNYLDWLNAQGESLIENATLTYNNIISNLGYSDYVQLAKKLFPNMVDLKEHEGILKELEDLKADKFESIYQAGDIIFNNELKSELKKRWIDYVGQTKSLKMLFRYLDQKSKASFEEFYFSILMEHQSQDFDRLVTEHARLIIGNLDFNDLSNKLKSTLVTYLVENHYEDYKMINPNKRFFRQIDSKGEYLRFLKKGKITLSNDKISFPRRRSSSSIIEEDLNISMNQFLLQIQHKMDADKSKVLLLKLKDIILIDLEDYHKDFIHDRIKLMFSKEGQDDENLVLYNLAKNFFDIQQNAIETYTTKFILGTKFQTDLGNFKNENAGVFKETTTAKVFSRDNNLSNSDAIGQQAVLNALSYYYPGLGQAAMALDNFFSINDEIKAYKDIHNKMNKISNDLFILEREINRCDTKRQIVLFEKQKAQLSQDLFEQKSLIYERIGDINKSEIGKVRLRLKTFLPFYYYLSEKLREQYELLNKSLRFWKGKSFQDLIELDAANLKYAIDPDIQLFEMFNFQNIGKRTNNFGIYSELTTIKNLINTNREKIKFSNLDYEFKTKKFSLAKEDSIVFVDSDFEGKDRKYNKRVVNIRVKLPKASLVDYENNQINHSGVYTISTEEKGTIIEVLSEQSINLTNVRGEFDQSIIQDSELLGSLNSSENGIAKSYVGYGAVSKWSLKLNKTYKPTDSVQVQIMYIYNSSKRSKLQNEVVYIMNKEHPMFVSDDKFEITINSNLLNISQVEFDRRKETIDPKKIIKKEELQAIINSDYYSPSRSSVNFLPPKLNSNE